MNNSKTSIFVKFDDNKKFLGAEQDIYNQTIFDNTEANHQDRNVQTQSDGLASDEAHPWRIR